MKMGLMKVCGFLTTTIIALILLVDFATACRGAPTVEDIKEKYCSFPIVIRARFLNIVRRAEIPRRSNIAITKVIKGPRNMKTDWIMDSGDCRRMVDDVEAQDYVIVGEVVDNSMIRKNCYESASWAWLHQKEHEALNLIESNGCN